jgi:hypothetical protein
MTLLGKVVALGAILTNSIPAPPTENTAALADRSLSIGRPVIIDHQTALNSSGTDEPWPLTAAPSPTYLSPPPGLEELLARLRNSSADPGNATDLDRNRIADETRRIIEIMFGNSSEPRSKPHFGGSWDEPSASNEHSDANDNDSSGRTVALISLGVAGGALALGCGLAYAGAAIEQRVREAILHGPGPGEFSGIAAHFPL